MGIDNGMMRLLFSTYAIEVFAPTSASIFLDSRRWWGVSL